MHEDIDPTPPLFGFVDHCGDITGFCDVGLDRHRLATGSADGRHHFLCLRGTGAMIDDHPKSPLRED